jgi:hypothetical protein
MCSSNAILSTLYLSQVTFSALEEYEQRDTKASELFSSIRAKKLPFDSWSLVYCRSLSNFLATLHANSAAFAAGDSTTKSAVKKTISAFMGYARLVGG